MRFPWKTSTSTGEASAERPVRCSFCNKSDVAKLIAGPAVFICDECVAVCVDILADDSKFTSAASVADDAQRLPSRPPAAATASACVLCGGPVQVTDALTIENRGMVCAECEGLVVHAVDNRWPEKE